MKKLVEPPARRSSTVFLVSSDPLAELTLKSKTCWPEMVLCPTLNNFAVKRRRE